MVPSAIRSPLWIRGGRWFSLFLMSLLLMVGGSPVYGEEKAAPSGPLVVASPEGEAPLSPVSAVSAEELNKMTEVFNFSSIFLLSAFIVGIVGSILYIVVLLLVWRVLLLVQRYLKQKMINEKTTNQ